MGSVTSRIKTAKSTHSDESRAHPQCSGRKVREPDTGNARVAAQEALV